MIDQKYPQHATCDDCKHVWIACWLPMAAYRVGRIFSTLRCPKCGTGNGNLRLLPTERQEPSEVPA